MGESVMTSTTATATTDASLLNVHWDMSSGPHVLLTEHSAVIIPSVKKLSSSSEQGIAAKELAGVMVGGWGKKKAWEQTVEERERERERERDNE